MSETMEPAVEMTKGMRSAFTVCAKPCEGILLTITRRSGNAMRSASARGSTILKYASFFPVSSKAKTKSPGRASS